MPKTKKTKKIRSRKPKTYNIKQWKGMEKMFTKKVKRSSSLLHGVKGSTWLKKPPKHSAKRASGNMM